MTETSSILERSRAVLVLTAAAATIAFNALAATGYVNGVSPDVISAKYPTLITPAGYAFSIWSLIYLGIVVFSIYQLLPGNSEKYKNVRSLFILSCTLNCGWIYMWHHDQIFVCLVLIVLLAATLFLINVFISQPSSVGSYWLTRAPFELYFGWVTAASLVNFAVLLVSRSVEFAPNTWTAIAITLIGAATAMGIFIRAKFDAYIYPLAIAWALAAIGVGQSGHTYIVTASAVGTIACLIASTSVVVKLPSSQTR